MSAFVVITTDDKYGALNPEVLGPFSNDEAAWDFIKAHLRHICDGHIEPIDGGYEGATVVSATTATDPSGYYEEDA